MASSDWAQVTAGIHTGECDLIAGDVGGIAVHAASRIESVLGRERSSFRDRARPRGGIGLVLMDRGAMELKGLEGSGRFSPCSRSGHYEGHYGHYICFPRPGGPSSRCTERRASKGTCSTVRTLRTSFESRPSFSSSPPTCSFAFAMPWHHGRHHLRTVASLCGECAHRTSVAKDAGGLPTTGNRADHWADDVNARDPDPERTNF